MLEMFQPESSAVVVQVIEDTTHQTTWGDVIWTALGLTGVLAIVAILVGLCLGGLFVWLRVARPTNSFNGEASENSRLGLTPGA